MFVQSRIFQRTFFLKELKTSVIAEALAQVSYTPKGWAISIIFSEPIEVWDSEHFNKVMGVEKVQTPFGDLREKNFTTELQAMRFLTRRLRENGWLPTENWLSHKN